jgi:hypothetical protein
VHLGVEAARTSAQARIEIQTYCGIIACLLLALWTGGKPTLRTCEMVCLYQQGWADEEELLAQLAILRPSVASARSLPRTPAALVVEIDSVELKRCMPPACENGPSIRATMSRTDRLARVDQCRIEVG